MRRLIRALGMAGAILVASVVGLGCVLTHRLPDAAPGSEALERAARIEAAVGLDAWNELSAVSFVFAGRNHHLWDRQRGLHRVEYGRHVVMYALESRRGRAWKNGKELHAEALDAALERAWSMWCNDTFWLYPFDKLRDPGVTLGAVDLADGSQGLLVHYGQGGVTPGDSYLWIIDADGLPIAWRMWVSVVPIPGLEASWEGWRDLPGGARVPTLHRLGPLALKVTKLKVGRSLSDVVQGADPFADILAASPTREWATGPE